MQRLAAAAVGAVMLATGCAGGHGKPVALSTAGTTGGACSGSAVTSGTATLSLRLGGHDRTVLVHVPDHDARRAKLPLVLNMHGSGSTALDQEKFTGMDATADADGFLVAYPQGSIADGSGYDWNVPGQPLIGGRAVPAGASDDVAFLTGLVTTLEGRYCVDPRRVYATGFSGGARMASQLACDSPRVFAAVAPVSGLRSPTPCPVGRAVSVLSFHGTADPVDPYAGDGQAYWTYDVPTAARDWAARDGCVETGTRSQPASTVTLVTYGGCRNDADVELYTISGEGHEWPGGPRLPRTLTVFLGPQSTAVNADDVMWAFFAAHPLS